MEARLADKLKQLNGLRSKILDKVYTFLPQKMLESTSVFHSVLLTATVLIIIAIFSTTRSLTLFSLHPICMTIGTMIFLAEGIVSYKNDSLLEAFSPIMQHTRKAKSRAIHQSMQITGSAFLLFGVLLIMSNKLEFHESLIPSSVHSLLGLLTIVLLCGQAVAGQQKYDQMESHVSTSSSHRGGGNDNANSKLQIRRWHGDAGLLVWDLLCLAVLSGLASFLSLTFTTLIVELSVLAAWFIVHAQMSAGGTGTGTGSSAAAGGTPSRDGRHEGESASAAELGGMLAGSAGAAVGGELSNQSLRERDHGQGGGGSSNLESQQLSEREFSDDE